MQIRAQLEKLQVSAHLRLVAGSSALGSLGIFSSIVFYPIGQGSFSTVLKAFVWPLMWHIGLDGWLFYVLLSVAVYLRSSLFQAI